MDILELEMVVKYLIGGFLFSGTPTCMRKFNSARAALATAAKNVLNLPQLVTELRQASGVEQLFSVPDKTLCCITNEALNRQNGATLLLDTPLGKVIYCMHKRFIPHAYRLFILSHFDEHIVQQYHLWVNEQRSIVPGDVTQKTIQKYIDYNNKSNLKSLLLTLSS